MKIRVRGKPQFWFSSFAVSENDLRPLIENRRLDDALKDKKLFIVDYGIFDGIEGMPNKKFITCCCKNTRKSLLFEDVKKFSYPSFPLSKK